MLSTRRLLIVVLLSLAGAAPLRATDLRSVLTEHAVSSWSEKDGLPDGSIYVLEQDADGYLWVGTEAGPYRFDGVRFTPWSALVPGTPARAVRALRSASDGSMWIGFGGQGGIAVFKHGLQRTYSTADGLPSATVSTLIEHPAGSFWAGTTLGLYRLRDARWERVGVADGVPEGPVNIALLTTGGRLLVATPRSLLQFDDEARRFILVTPLAEDPRGLVEDPLGRVTVSDQVAGYRDIARTLPGEDQVERGRGRALLRDRRGNLWVGTGGQGLWRVRFDDNGDVLFNERATVLTGLLADGIAALTEDREGNIWAATPEGINRITPYKVAQVTNIGLVAGVEQAGNGALWVGTVDGLLQMGAPTVRTPSRLIDLGGARLLALHTDKAGVLWVATDRGLSRWIGGRLAPVSSGGMPMPHQIDTITSDAKGGVWAFDAERGLLHWSRGGFAAVPIRSQTPGARVEAAYTDSAGRAWFALSSGEVATILDDEVRVYDRDDGLDAGVYQTIFEDRDHIVWLGGTEGLSRYAAGAFVTVRSDAGFPAANLTAIVEDARGELWIGSGSGILRLPRTDFERMIGDGEYHAQFRLLDRSDGLAGLPLVYSRNRRATTSADGRLWFVTGRGLTIVDPAALDTTEVPAVVRIEAVVTNDLRLRPAEGLALAAGTNRLEFEYTAVNLTSPLRQHFRFKLEGFDRDWIDGGTRRQAFYTNLPPRQYRFRVMSTDANGEWVEPGAAWTFSIKPMFYQTRWFTASVVAALVLIVGAAWRLHVRSVRRRFALLIGERALLSRELHDTLLQNLVGIALQFDAIANDPQFSFSQSQRQHFVRMRRRVEAYMREARQSIADLRSPRVGTHDLSVALKEAAERAINGHPIQFAFEQRGTPQPIPARIEEQLLKIGREAIGNAVRHAQADRITAELVFDDAALRLRVSDNGTGFDPEANGADDHYGLTGMRERAEDIGGHLTIQTKVGRGTRVEAEVPLQSVRGRDHGEVAAHQGVLR
jgi:signal transduction histidine kinase/ligand-binding sensor domain-containing protein